MDGSKINEIVQTALNNLSKAAEVNTIIGQPLVTMDGATILPVSKVTFAFMAGGGDYGNAGANKAFGKTAPETNFAGGTGGGASLTPVGFLVVDRDGVRMIEADGSSILSKVIDIGKDIFGRSEA